MVDTQEEHVIPLMVKKAFSRFAASTLTKVWRDEARLDLLKCSEIRYRRHLLVV